MSRRLAALLAAAALLASLAPPALAVGVANDDAYGVDEDVVLSVGALQGVLLNDVPGVGLATAVLDTPPVHDAAFSLAADGSFSYTPGPDFHGTDTFTYHTLDVLGDPSTAATVTITVDPVNDAPVAHDADCNPGPLGGSYLVPEDWPEVTFLPVPCGGPYATDVDGDSLTYALVDDALHGVAAVIPEGFATYTPDPDFSTPYGEFVSDAFTFKANDGTVDSNVATVPIWVAPVNDAPTFTAGAAVVEVDEDSGPYDAPWASAISPGPANESDQVVTFEVTVRPEDEHAFSVLPSVGTDGSLTFTPAPDAFWLAEVTVIAHDDGGLEDWQIPQSMPDDTSDAATFDIVIWPTPDAAVAVDDEATVWEDVATPVDVLANDFDPDQDPADPVRVVSATDGTKGSVSVDPSGLGVTYAPDADATGADSFTYTVNGGDTATVAVEITPVADAPIAEDASATTDEDTSVGLTLEGTHPEGGNLTFAVDQPTHGTVTLGALVCVGTVPRVCSRAATYAPDEDYAGSDSFTYTVTDGTTTSSPATVSLEVTGTPDAPSAAPDALNALEDGPAVTLDPRMNDVDVDGDALTVTGVSQGAKGSVTFDGGSVTYVPTADMSGSDSFTYTIGDGTGRFDTATVNVAIGGINDQPTIGRAWRLFVEEDAGPTTRTIRTTLTAGPGDTGQTLTAHVVGNTNPSLFSSQPVLTVTPTGLAVAVTPAANRTGRAVISMVIKDSGGADNGGVDTSEVRWFVLTIIPVNDPPNAVNDVSFSVGRNAGPTSLAVLANDTGAPDSGETLTIVAKTNGSNGVVAITGGGTGLTYKPNVGFTGTDTFTYTISDGHGGTDTATVLVTVVG